MNSARVRAVVILLLMALTAIAAEAWKPTRHLSDQRPKFDLEAVFPISFGNWTVDRQMPVQLVSPDVQALLNKIYNQTLSRTYVNRQGTRVMLSVAYGGDQSDSTRAHRPEVCYPAQGFQILSATDGQLHLAKNPLRARQLVAQLGTRTEPITYWITVGEQITLGGFEQKIAQLSYGFRGLIPDGALVRVSTIDTNVAAAFKQQEAFLAELAAALPTTHQRLIFGAGS